MIRTDQIRQAMVDVDQVTEVVGRLIGAPLPFNRVLPFVASAAASFISPSLLPKEATWNNNGGDYYVTRLGYVAWQANSSTPAEVSPSSIADTGAGLGSFKLSEDSSRSTLFDFEWNMRRRTTGSMYGVPNITGTQFLSRKLLGNMERQEWLRFERPLLIPMGDALTFAIRPLGYCWGPHASAFTLPWRFTINIIIDGFRVGVR